jgi:GNAT superfamily N-acetyltransferase
VTLDVTLLAEPGPPVREAILDTLIAHNTRAAGPARWVPFAVVLRAPGETRVQGGLWAACYYDWCFIELLAVPEASRGQGLGRRLMAEAEAFARTYGATGIWLDTFSFQARGFYEKLGFAAFGQIEDHPRGGRRFFMQKRLLA